MDNRTEQEKFGGWVNGELIDEVTGQQYQPKLLSPADIGKMQRKWKDLPEWALEDIENLIYTLQTYTEMWYGQYQWLERLRDSGQRTKAMAALFNMQDIEKRYLNPEKKEK